MSRKSMLTTLILFLLSWVGYIQLGYTYPAVNQVHFKIAATEPLATLPPLTEDSRISVAFTYNQANVYTDPYRQVKRQGDNLEALIIEEISAARQSIDIAVQTISLPLIAQALVARKKAGVTVRWITENGYVQPWGTLDIDEIADLAPESQDVWAEFDDLIDTNKDGELSDEEIDEREVYALFNNNSIPWIDDTADGSLGSGLMHHKFMVIDGKKVVTGSANFTLSGIHGDMDVPQSFGNAEDLVVIDSPELATIYTQEFNLMWGDGPGGKTDSLFGLKKPDRPTQVVQVGNAQVQVHFAPTSAGVPYDKTSSGMIATALNQAQKTVDMAQFVFSDQDLANLLGHLFQERSVQMRGVFHSTFASQRYSSTLDMWGLKLADDQCKLYPELYPWQPSATQIGVAVLSSTDKLHHKFAVIDDETVITGSQNWSNAGNRENDENALIIKSSVIAAHFKREMERLFQGATLGPSASLKNQVEETRKRCGEIPPRPLPSVP
jgi:phosphatidylserine/phosphatidylglycerophosphate/cardiolipin synthase-like enzyme